MATFSLTRGHNPANRFGDMASETNMNLVRVSLIAAIYPLFGLLRFIYFLTDFVNHIHERYI